MKDDFHDSHDEKRFLTSCTATRVIPFEIAALNLTSIKFPERNDCSLH